MSFEDIKDKLAEYDPEMLLADGFEEALIGYIEQNGRVVAAYDRETCIKILMHRDEMSWEDAEEYFDVNVAGSYMGDKSPAFLTNMRMR